MGYDLHITRKDDWSDDDLEREITLKEWLAYINADPDLVLSDAYRIKVPGSDTESQVAPGFCEWTAHSLRENPWFAYNTGSISTKNPDEDTMKKMLSIAEILRAKVQGDDGEIYTLSPNSQIRTSYLGNELLTSKKPAQKPWWKLW